MRPVQEGFGGGRSVVPSRHGQKGDALIGFQGLILQLCPKSAAYFLRSLKNKVFQEGEVTIIGLYAIRTVPPRSRVFSMTLESVEGDIHL